MDKIIGHEKVKLLLQRIIQEEKVAHAYLFTGKEGIGKKKMAIEFAKRIVKQTENEVHELSYQLISPENDVIKVEAVRNLIADIYLKPIDATRKVFIIDDADKMNTNAQNALLKVLEEPPVYATLILVTSQKEKIIKTILSRVTEINFSALSQEELKEILPGKELDWKMARGSVSKALTMIEDEAYQVAMDRHYFIIQCLPASELAVHRYRSGSSRAGIPISI